MNKSIFNFAYTYQTNMVMYKLLSEMVRQSSFKDKFSRVLEREAGRCLVNLTDITPKQELKIFGEIDDVTHIQHLVTIFSENLQLKWFYVFNYVGFPEYFKCSKYLEELGYKRTEALTPNELEELTHKTDNLIDFVLKDIEASLGQMVINEFLSILFNVAIDQRELISNASSRLALLLINEQIPESYDIEYFKELARALMTLNSKCSFSVNDRKLKVSESFRCNKDTQTIPKLLFDLHKIL